MSGPSGVSQEPGPEVTAVRDRLNVCWRRLDDRADLWWGDTGKPGDQRMHVYRWDEFQERGPFTDATGDDR